MKDYFNWIGCKSSKKERYIQRSEGAHRPQDDVNHLKKKGTSNFFTCAITSSDDVNHLKKKGTSNVCVVVTGVLQM